MTRTSWVALLIAAAVAVPRLALAQDAANDVVVPAKGAKGQTIGQIDWTQQEITAEGAGVPAANTSEAQGRLMACRAAEVEARRNLLEVIHGMQIDSETTVINYVTQNDTIRTKIQGMVQATTMEKHVDADGTCTVHVRLGIHETKGKPSLAEAVLPSVPSAPPPGGAVVGAKPSAPITPAVTPPAVVAAPPPAAPAPTTGAVGEVAKTSPGGPVYTGVVVDARGLAARPAMSPKVLDDAGEPIYGSAFVSRDYAIEHGLAGYSKNMDAATRNTRVTDNPLTVKAASASGSAKADLVLTKEDALKLRTAAQSQSFLAQARVMIVLD